MNKDIKSKNHAYAAAKVTKVTKAAYADAHAAAKAYADASYAAHAAAKAADAANAYADASYAAYVDRLSV